MKKFLFKILFLCIFSLKIYTGYHIVSTVINLNGFKLEHLVVEGVCTDIETQKKTELLGEQITIKNKSEGTLVAVVRSKGIEVVCNEKELNVIEKIGILSVLPSVIQDKNPTKLIPIKVYEYDSSFIESLKNSDIALTGVCKSTSSSENVNLDNHPVVVIGVTPVKNAGFINVKSHLSSQYMECDINKTSVKSVGQEFIIEKQFESTPISEKVGQVLLVTGECFSRGDISADLSETKATLISVNGNDYNFIVNRKQLVAPVTCSLGKFTYKMYRPSQGERDGR